MNNAVCRYYTKHRSKIWFIVIIICITLSQGWRAIWVQYKEALLAGEDKITSMRITAPKTNRRIYPLYIDLLRLVEKLTKETRDKIVPTIGQGLYTRNNLWQQTYRWSQVH